MKPITLEQYMDPDFYPEESFELAEQYIKQINDIIVLNKLKVPIVLEHNLSFYISPADNSKRMFTEYAFKYITKIYKEAGWLADYNINCNNFKITISHPKSVFK